MKVFVRPSLFVLGLTAACVFCPAPRAGESAPPAPAGAPRVSFNRDIRPILAENCFACHGADHAARKGDLRLDRRDDALKAKAFVPGKPDDSELIDRITSSVSSRLMPPPKSGKKLTAAQKETLTRWVAAGAAYQAHWAFLPPVRPEPPAVRDERAGSATRSTASSWPGWSARASPLHLKRIGKRSFAASRSTSPDCRRRRRRSISSSTTKVPRPTSGSWTACWPARLMASTGRASGSTWRATPTRPATRTTRRARSGSSATT